MTMLGDKKYFTVRAVGTPRFRDENPHRFGLKLEVLEGDEAGETKWWNGDLGEGWAEKTIEALILLGWNGVDDGSYTGLGTTKAVAVEVDNEYPPGTVNRKVKWINAYKAKGFSGGKGKGGVLGPKYKRLIQAVKVEIPEEAKLPDESKNPF